MNFLKRTDESSILNKVVTSLAPDNTMGQTRANFAWLNAYVILVIILVLWSWIFPRSRFDNMIGAATATLPNAAQQGANMGGSFRDDKFYGGSPVDSFYGSGTDVDSACGDVSSEMNYAMNIISQKNPTATANPFWPQYYQLLNAFLQLKKAANNDSSQAADASDAFDRLKEFEQNTGFNPLQNNPDQSDAALIASNSNAMSVTSTQTVVPAGTTVVAPATSTAPATATVVASDTVVPAGTVVAPPTSGFRSNRNNFLVKGSRAGVGGFRTNRESHFLPQGSRAGVGGFRTNRDSFRSGRFADMGGGDSSADGHAALILASGSTMPPLYQGGGGTMGTAHQYVKQNPMNTTPSQSFSLGPVDASFAAVGEDDLQQRLHQGH